MQRRDNGRQAVPTSKEELLPCGSITTPVEVVFGTGKLDELGQLMAERGLDRALIVSDPFTHRSGVAARLKECAGGRVLDIISEVEPQSHL